tara:strand:+ start:1685 stop:2869 length:1185 start_codon:yes stop_codon:yes gene_type:complete
MSREENLFEGISIMSPQDLEKTISGAEVSETEDDDNDHQEAEEGLTITPVSTSNSKEDAEEEEGKRSPAAPTSEPPAGNNAYAAIIKDMIKDGVLTAGEEAELEELLKDANADTIKQLMKGTVNDAFKAKEANWKNNMSPDKKRFLEIEDAFSSADQAIQMAQRLEFFENITEDEIREDENLQKNLYFDDLISKGFSNEDAKEAVEEAEALDKLSEKALKSLPSLRKGAFNVVEASRQQKTAAQTAQNERYRESFDNLIKTIDGKEAFVPGLNLNKVSKDKLKSNITDTVFTDNKGVPYTSLMYKQMRNPAEFEMMINYYDTLGLFNLDKDGSFKPDISKLKGVAKTQAVSEIDRVLAANNERGIGRGTSEGSEKTQGILDLLERATKDNKRRK